MAGRPMLLMVVIIRRSRTVERTLAPWQQASHPGVYVKIAPLDWQRSAPGDGLCSMLRHVDCVAQMEPRSILAKAYFLSGPNSCSPKCGHRVLTTEIPLVSACTATNNIHKPYVLPTQCFYVFCVDLRTAIISLYSINWLLCITETERVFTARYGLGLYI